MDNQVKYMQGNEAIVRGAIAAGAKFFGGYPITPSNEIAAHSSVMLPLVGGTFIQMEDEMASMGAVIGASAAGLKAYTATSGLGFSLMQEHIGHAIMCEVPCVIVDVQRGGPATGLATKPAQGDIMQARWGTNGDHTIIALSPSSVEECYECMLKAFYYAEKYRGPVVVLSDAITGHLLEGVTLRKPNADEIAPPRIPDCAPENYNSYNFDADNPQVLAPLGSPWQVHLCSAVHDETGKSAPTPANSDKTIKYLYNKIEDHTDDIVITKEYDTEDAEIVIVSYGITARSARAAVENLRAEGIKAGLLQMVTVWPFAKKAVEKVFSQAKLVVVPEMNLGQIYDEMKKYNTTGTRMICVNKVRGELITPAEITVAIKEEMGNGQL